MAFVAVAITALTAVLGIVFAQTQQTERVAAAAEQQSEASAAFRLIESMSSRSEGALITVAAHNAQLTGSQERDDAVIAVSEVQEAIANSPLSVFEGQLADELATLIAYLEDGDTDAARTQLDDVIDPISGQIQSQAGRVFNDAATVIEVETGVAGRWGLFTSFGVGLLAPLLLLTVFRSFVNRRRNQEQLEQELLRTKELGEAKDDMIGNLSHELRTPLTGILGFAMTLEETGFDDGEFAAEMNSYVVRDASDLNRMVEDLLVAAKVENEGLNFSPEDIGIEREVDEALVAYKMSEKTITKDIENTHVHADRLRTRQIVRNLISNADKHGGQNVTIRGRAANGRYRLDVIDDGTGVTPELSDRLFSRFVHDGDAPLTKGSVGVGLSVAQALATGMGCRVEHTQSPGQTIFTVDFPLAATATPTTSSQLREDLVPKGPESKTTRQSSARSPLSRPGRKTGDDRPPVVAQPTPPPMTPAPAGSSYDFPADPFA